jgi:uncharacterized membrane protein
MGNKFWSVKNVLTTLKLMVISAMISIPIYLMSLLAKTVPIFIGLLLIAYVIFILWWAGFLAHKFWVWK